MTQFVPSSRPKITRDEILKLIAGENITDKVFLVGLRGYYRNTMGNGQNQRGIYDDAIVLVGPDFFATFNANTDPTCDYRPGLAVLKPGRWLYKVGIHGVNRPVEQQYTALVQAGEVTVVRDGQGEDTGFFGINIHHGSYAGTSSLGCQTIYPTQWDSFIHSVRDQLDRVSQKIIPYVLIDCA